MNKEHQSILDLKLPFRNYDARIAFVCFEVPCCFEVHVPVYFICGLVRLTRDIMHARLKGSLLCTSSLAFPIETVSEVFTGSKRKREG